MDKENDLTVASITPAVFVRPMRDAYPVPESERSVEIAVDHLAEHFAGHDLPFDI